MNRTLLLRVALAPLLAAACGVPADDAPRPIPSDRVPFQLLDPAPDPTPAPGAPQGSASVTVYMVSGDRLSPVRRDVPPPASPGRALQALQAGVVQEEAARNVRTAIPPTARIAAGDDGQGHWRVELTPAFLATARHEQILAVAQIVYTLTEFPGVDSVAFTLSGRSVEVPSGDGALKTGALRRADFAAVANL